MLKLTPTQFAAIFDALRDAGASGGSDKRQHTRMQVQAQVRLATIARATGKIARGYTALTRDISYSGIGVMQFTPAEHGDGFIIFLPQGKGKAEDVVIRCTTRFSRPLAEGVFGVGGEFEEVASPELVKQLQQNTDGALERIRQSVLN